MTYEEARLACRSDGGELLSIETESEQRLVERFIQQLKVGEGDYWIGLRRNPQRSRPAGASPPACPSQYYWLDGSRAKFRWMTRVYAVVLFRVCFGRGGEDRGSWSLK